MSNTKQTEISEQFIELCDQSVPKLQLFDKNKNDISIIVEIDEKMTEKALSRRIPALGIILALISVLLYSPQAVIVKVLNELNAIEILVFRSIFQLICYSLVAVIQKHTIFVDHNIRKYLILRCVAGVIFCFSWFFALRLMPFAEIITMVSAQPVFVTIFAYFMLKEQITIVQILSCVFCIIGVVFISKPQLILSSDTITNNSNHLMGVILAIICLNSGALTAIYIRKLKTIPAEINGIWLSISLIFSGAFIIIIMDLFIWPISFKTWTLLLIIGLFGVIELYLRILAFKYENAGPITVILTLNVAFSYFWSIVFLGEHIEWTSILGSVIISMCVAIQALHKWFSEKPDLVKKFCEKVCFKSNQIDK